MPPPASGEDGGRGHHLSCSFHRLDVPPGTRCARAALAAKPGQTLSLPSAEWPPLGPPRASRYAAWEFGCCKSGRGRPQGVGRCRTPTLGPEIGDATRRAFTRRPRICSRCRAVGGCLVLRMLRSLRCDAVPLSVPAAPRAAPRVASPCHLASYCTVPFRWPSCKRAVKLTQRLPSTRGP